MEAATYTHLAAALAPAWRVLALDQRGHGYSDHAQSYTREDYLGDLLAFLDHLGLDNAVLVGNSVGGANAYQLAARYPDRVRALVIEDIGVVVDADTSFTLAWSGTFPSREALADRVGERFLPYLQDSFRQTPEGWRLAFDPEELLISQRQLHGDYWADWLASACPALLIRGRDSRVTAQAQLEEMAARRPNTRLVTLGGGHVIHQDDPTGFAGAVLTFLSGL
jgi:pimeloyl-ACP methyl ester carboxylesterase